MLVDRAEEWYQRMLTQYNVAIQSGEEKIMIRMNKFDTF